MSSEDYERWERQIATPYAELSEGEKQADRDQVMRYWPLIDRELQVLRERVALLEKAGERLVRECTISDEEPAAINWRAVLGKTN